MIVDVWTIVWKEWKELIQLRTSGKAGALRILFFVAIMGIVVPLNTGRNWMTSPATIFFALWVPLFLVASIVTDAFAGERDRHTLETLLASRLSDRAILMGKIMASVSYGWGLALLVMLIATVSINLAYSSEGFIFYSLYIALGIVLSSLLTAFLSATIGVLISFRASSARQAQQAMSIAMMLLLFVPVFGIQALPQDWQRSILGAVTSIDPARLFVYSTLFLVALDVLLLGLAAARFKRTRLILS